MGVIARWREYLPVGPETPELTLGEGDTPLVHAPRLSEQLGLDLYLKVEGANPTGSFKDRGMVVAVAKALEDGARGVVCASTGNTAASAAAYAARAGIEALILHPAGAVAGPKLAQARITGANIVAIDGSFDDSLRACLAVAESGSHVLVNSLNPNRIEGQKTAAFEICEQLGRAPQLLALPYGGGGNTVAYAAGFADARRGLPRIVSAESTQRATTVASAIRISEPVHRNDVEGTGATVVGVGDDELLEAWSELARLEGLFCEPASAAGYAALKRLRLDVDLAVCVLTGNGLKDPALVDAVAPADQALEAAS
ncbi:MAG TPA: threonine synthase [Gaiellaceae bacterium]|jgi:threonine synthase